MIEQKYIDRFHTKYNIDQQSQCWHWNSGKDIDGYGRYSVKIEGKFRNLGAHRFSWTLANKSDWPVDKPLARHLCNNPSCVNPDHIVPGTYKENAADCYAAGRQSKNWSNITRTVTCPHCGKTGNNGIMKRWHFDHCKTLSW